MFIKNASKITDHFNPFLIMMGKCWQIHINVTTHQGPCADPEGVGGQGSRPPLENYKNIGFLSNTGPDPLKITKLPIQHSMLGHHLPAREMPFKWCFAGWPLMAH